LNALSAKGRLARFAALFLSAHFAGSALAKNISVPGDAATIQDAVNAALGGDTVLVKPGVYHEFVLLNGRLITLKCDGPAFSAIIEPPSDKAAITFMNGESSVTSVIGFTMRNCAIGVNIVNGGPTLEGNWITNCGTGIFSQSGGLFLTNEIVACQNGIVLQGSSVVRGNSIHDCAKGIHVDAADPLIRENFIFNNSDIGIEIGVGGSTLIQNVVYNNAHFGVAWNVTIGARGTTLIHNTVVAAANATATQASGLPGSSFLGNNILVGDPAFRLDTGAQSPIFDHNLLFSPTGATVTGLTIPPDGHNIVTEPQFIGAASGDFDLAAISAAIDAANPTNSVEADIAGNLRPIEGNGDGVALPDIGAYEFIPGILRPPINFTAFAYSNRVELSWLASDPSSQFAISRSTNFIGPFLPLLDAAGSNATDAAVIPLTTYYYVIATKNGANESKPSPIAAARPGNHPPSASSDSIQTLEDTAVLFTLPILSDQDGDAVHITRLMTPAPAEFTLTNSTQILYVPPPDFFGNAAVQYEVTDGFGSFATNSLFVNIKGVDDAPAWIAPFQFAIAANATTALAPVATDIDTRTLQFRVTQQPTAGYVFVSGTNFIYRPVRGFSGQDSFAAVVSDGQLESAEATFSVSVGAGFDLDNDSIPDDWENFWDVNNPNADPDNDGLTNLQEFMANTSPHDPASAVKVSRVERTVDGFLKVTWPAVGGVRYRVFSADQLTGHASDFLPLVQDISLEMELAPDGANVERAFIDTRPLTTNQRFYRIAVISAASNPGGPIFPPFISGGVVDTVPDPNWNDPYGVLAPTPAPIAIGQPNHL
jgi:hypothetical protein